MDMSGSLTCVVVAVDGSEVSMEALRWALDNLKLSPSASDSSFVVLHVQPSPSVAAGVSPGTIPFGGPSGLEVPAFTAAIEHHQLQQHQKQITDTILEHARQVWADRSVNVKIQVVIGDPKYKICETVENLHGDHHPKIGEGAMLGACVTMLGNISIGAGEMVAAVSLVLKDVPPHRPGCPN